MRARSRFGLVVSMTLLLARVGERTQAQEKPRYLALITDIKGEVLAKKAERADFEKAYWGMQLSQGDQVKTLADAEVSFLFSNNNLISLGPNSTLTLSEGRAPGNGHDTSVRKMDTQLLADNALLTLRKTSGGEIGALAGLRSADARQKIVPLSPRGSKIKRIQPSFEWTAANEFDRFKVKLFDSNGVTWSKETETTRLEYPQGEPPLSYGESYFWQVEGEGLFESAKSASVGFRLPSQQELEKVKAQEEKIRQMFKDDLEGSSFHFVLGAYYDREGFFEDAIKHFEVIARMYPDAPLPHQILGKLCTSIGLKDKAIAELEKAINLGQDR